VASPVHPHALRRRLALLACALALAGSARAAEPDPAPAPAPAADRPAAEEPPAKPAGEERSAKEPRKAGEEDDDTWIDVGHAFVEQRIFAPVLRLDRFFSDERDIEAERSRSFLRWRSEVRFDGDRGSRPAFTTGVRATLRLPGLNRQLRRLRVVIAGETRDAVSALFPKEPGQPGEDAGEEVEGDEIGDGDAGLRFYLWDTLLSHADLGGGVLFRLPPGAYGRLRFRWAIPVRKLFLTRAALTGFWRTDTEFGTSAALELERPFTSMLIGRISGGATITEVSPGFEWITELAVLAALDARSGAQVGVAMSGATAAEAVVLDATTGLPRLRSKPGIDRYRIYTRLRRDVYRRWLFLELEPEVAWPWTPEEGRHGVWGLAFRLEVQFHGNEAPARPPRPEPPEPADPPEARSEPPAEETSTSTATSTAAPDP
jgi:hypothetical protein